MDPNISIVVPVYNTSEYIEKCLKSLTNQTLTNIEVILVDDGSTDSSGKIIDEFAKNDSRIRAIHMDHRGAAIARNIGIENASGEYVGFVDSDDWVEETMFETLFKNAKNKNCDISRCGCLKHMEDGTTEEYITVNTTKVFQNSELIQYIIPAMIGRSPRKPEKDDVVWGSACPLIFSRELILKNNIRFDDTKIYEDVIFSMKALAASQRMVHVSKPLYHYRFNKKSFQHSYHFEKWSAGLYLYNQKKRLAKEYCLPDESIDRAALNLLFIARMAMANECLNSNPGSLPKKIDSIKEICNNSDLQNSINLISKYKMKPELTILSFLIKFRLALVIYTLFNLKYGKKDVLSIHLK